MQVPAPPTSDRARGTGAEAAWPGSSRSWAGEASYWEWRTRRHASAAAAVYALNFIMWVFWIIVISCHVHVLYHKNTFIPRHLIKCESNARLHRACACWSWRLPSALALCLLSPGREEGHHPCPVPCNLGGRRGTTLALCPAAWEGGGAPPLPCALQHRGMEQGGRSQQPRPPSCVAVDC